MPSQSLVQKRRKRRRIFTVASVLLGVAAAAICSEVALRVYTASRGWTANCYVTGLIFFVPDPHSGHTLRPGLRLRSSTYDVTVNSIGLRGPEIENLPDPPTTRIAVLGGSSVFGYLVPDGQDSCRILEQELKDRGVATQVLNGGVPGFNMTQCRHRYEHMISRLKPEYVILYLGWNDLPFLLAKQTSDRPDKTPPAPSLVKRVLAHSTLYGFLKYRIFPNNNPRFAPPASLATEITDAGAEAFTKDVYALLATIRQSGAKPIISTQLMAACEQCKGLDDYLGSTPEQVAVNRQLGQWISNKLREVAEQERIPLIDCASELSCNSSMLGDAIHLTRKGHEAVAKKWATALMLQLQGDDATKHTQENGVEL